MGAEPRLPAIAMMPTSTKEMVIPIVATKNDCQNEMPKP